MAFRGVLANAIACALLAAVLASAMDDTSATRALHQAPTADAHSAPSMANEATVERGTLPGRFFIVGRDLSARPTPDVGMDRSLYELPAAGGPMVQRLPDYRRVSDLVWYGSTSTVGINNRETSNRGLFLVGASTADAEVSPMLSPQLALIYSKVIELPPPSTEPPLRVFPTQVVLSPDGKQVAGVDGNNRLCVAQRNAAKADRCDAGRHACDGSTPTWSPDGREVAFAAGIPADNGACNLYELFVMDVASGTVRQLTDIPGPPIGAQAYGNIVNRGETLSRWHKTNKPRWSPDGRWIAFTTIAGIGVIHPDGTGLSVVAKGTGATWSPDGTMIAYRVQGKTQPKGARYPGYNTVWTLFVSRPDGTGAVEVPMATSGSMSVEDVVWTN